MGALVQVHANGLLDASTDQSGAAVRLTTGPLRNRLMTANGSATSAGTELATSGGYTSGTGAPTIAFGAAAAAVSTSTSAQTVTNMPATTVVGIEIWDSAGTPLRKWWGALAANKVTNAGDTYSQAIGAVTLSLAV